MHGENEIIVSGLSTLKVQVFRTNVNKHWQAEMLCEIMSAEFPLSKCNFDLEDIDKIFRIETYHNIALEVIEVLRRHGFEGQEL
jgi:hypothetical protein